MFKWNGDHGDKEQVRPYLARYAKLREEGLSYNDDFKGKIPGVAGSPDEDRAIYDLSCLWRIEQEKARVAAALANGFIPIVSGVGRQRFGKVITYKPGHYVGGTGLIKEYEAARVMFDAEGKPFAVIPKGKRNGYDARHVQVFAR